MDPSYIQSRETIQPQYLYLTTAAYPSPSLSVKNTLLTNSNVYLSANMISVQYEDSSVVVPMTLFTRIKIYPL